MPHKIDRSIEAELKHLSEEAAHERDFNPLSSCGLPDFPQPSGPVQTNVVNFPPKKAPSNAKR